MEADDDDLPRMKFGAYDDDDEEENDVRPSVIESRPKPNRRGSICHCQSGPIDDVLT